MIWLGFGPGTIRPAQNPESTISQAPLARRWGHGLGAAAAPASAGRLMGLEVLT